MDLWLLPFRLLHFVLEFVSENVVVSDDGKPLPVMKCQCFCLPSVKNTQTGQKMSFKNLASTAVMYDSYVASCGQFSQ